MGCVPGPSLGALLTCPQHSPAYLSPIPTLMLNGHGAAVEGTPKHHLPMTVGVCHNQQGTDPMLRRAFLAPGVAFCGNLSHHGQAFLLPHHRDPLEHILCPCPWPRQ